MKWHETDLNPIINALGAHHYTICWDCYSYLAEVCFPTGKSSHCFVFSLQEL